MYYFNSSAKIRYYHRKWHLNKTTQAQQKQPKGNATWCIVWVLVHSCQIGMTQGTDAIFWRKNTAETTKWLDECYLYPTSDEATIRQLFAKSQHRLYEWWSRLTRMSKRIKKLDKNFGSRHIKVKWRTHRSWKYGSMIADLVPNDFLLFSHLKKFVHTSLNLHLLKLFCNSTVTWSCFGNKADDNWSLYRIFSKYSPVPLVNLYLNISIYFLAPEFIFKMNFPNSFYMLLWVLACMFSNSSHLINIYT